ncbi:MAG: hypothetical protein R2781_09485 [Flavobacteriaceae bacterium]
MNQVMSIGTGHIDATNIQSRAIGDTIAMQLASITYCSLNGKGAVKKTLAAYLPNWQVVWEPIQALQGDWAFIAYNGVQYVIAIRGSILNFSWGAFDNWFEQDFNLFEQVPWVYTHDTSTSPMISKGSSNSLQNLMQLVDENGDTILSFLQKYAFPQQKWIGITGHSLGANSATIVGPWLRYELVKGGFAMPTIFSVLTFAAPCSWNAAFAAQFDAYLTHTWRYYNVLDVVPFSANNVIGIGTLFPPPAPNAKSITVTYKGVTMSLADACDAIQFALDVSEGLYNSFYTPVNKNRGSIPLNNAQEIFSVTATDPLLQWFEQVGQQHAHNHYLKWLGAGPLTCAQS